jgi:hypothetical protein
MAGTVIPIHSFTGRKAHIGIGEPFLLLLVDPVTLVMNGPVPEKNSVNNDSNLDRKCEEWTLHLGVDRRWRGQGSLVIGIGYERFSLLVRRASPIRSRAHEMTYNAPDTI